MKVITVTRARFRGTKSPTETASNDNFERILGFSEYHTTCP
jgi:hypothetical protein